ncbi:hypothetical protein AVEN_201645-1 [Araneus ventricosus]|uniref:Uncharacterized protein n=1 Tax=Araneus ventricosus TaxID=182803 RepID=A0A4Y2U626_ARAVE|nr:hypothetical protein AVEN_239001-1 [Araneus ventricosus]GBO07080.1 hypothetical protein AVEN_250358-1 [Araneus ventricosus]GBO07081.1 hypothetical protein AVEN_201645-1 [Araneus ventricosus]
MLLKDANGSERNMAVPHRTGHKSSGMMDQNVPYFDRWLHFCLKNTQKSVFSRFSAADCEAWMGPFYECLWKRVNSEAFGGTF